MSSINNSHQAPAKPPVNPNFESAFKRLSLAIENNHELTELEMLAVTSLGFTILAGDFQALKTFMQGYRENTAPLQRIVCGLARAMNTQDVIIDYSPVVDWFKAQNGQNLEVAAISIYLVPVHRLICVSTHEKHQDYVHQVSTTGGYRHMAQSNDDAGLLMRQIGHISALPSSVGPPVISAL